MEYVPGTQPASANPEPQAHARRCRCHPAAGVGRPGVCSRARRRFTATSSRRIFSSTNKRCHDGFARRGLMKVTTSASARPPGAVASVRSPIPLRSTIPPAGDRRDAGLHGPRAARRRRSRRSACRSLRVRRRALRNAHRRETRRNRTAQRIEHAGAQDIWTKLFADPMLGWTSDSPRRPSSPRLWAGRRGMPPSLRPPPAAGLIAVGPSAAARTAISPSRLPISSACTAACNSWKTSAAARSAGRIQMRAINIAFSVARRWCETPLPSGGDRSCTLFLAERSFYW